MGESEYIEPRVREQVITLHYLKVKLSMYL